MKIKSFIKSIWEIPQNIVGAIVKKVCKATPLGDYKDATVYSWNGKNGVSLGKYIFVPFTKFTPDSPSFMHYIQHEYGHTVQSRYLGWLYLPVISLPSLIWAGCFDKYRKKTGVDYYDFYTESWANKLGGLTGEKK